MSLQPHALDLAIRDADAWTASRPGAAGGRPRERGGHAAPELGPRLPRRRRVRPRRRLRPGRHRGAAWDGEPPTPERRVEQLRALLAALGAPPPYVLVGHSWGGPLIRVFAGRYPDEVAGLVYVDPTDFSQGRAELLALIESLAPGKGEEELQAGIEMQRSFSAQAPPGVRAEMDVLLAFMEEEVEARGFGPELAVPLAVLLGAKYVPPPPGLDMPGAIASRTAFDAMTQQRIRKMSTWALAAPEGLFVLANYAGHFVHRDDPGLVVEAVRRVVFPDVPRQLWEALMAGGDVAETYRALVPLPLGALRRGPPQRARLRAAA